MTFSIAMVIFPLSIVECTPFLPKILVMTELTLTAVVSFSGSVGVMVSSHFQET